MIEIILALRRAGSVKKKINGLNEFTRGIWYAIQEIVIHTDQPEIANKLIHNCGMTRAVVEALHAEDHGYGDEKIRAALDVLQEPKSERQKG